MSNVDIQSLRAQFPLLARDVRGKPLIYFDNAATTQKPDCVIHAIESYYRTMNSNVHRGAHYLADQATEAFEQARDTVREFIGAARREEIIWTRGTTEAINLVANGLRPRVRGEHNVVISAIEHHANIVPWQRLCQLTGAELRVMPVLDSGEIDLPKGLALIDSDTLLVAIAHVSNSLGTINPVEAIVAAAKQHGALTLIDGAQAIAHGFSQVQTLGCDFYAFSGHKVFGPTGIGVLYGRHAVLDTLDVWQTGGEMIEKVSFAGTTYTALPYRLEAGTPNIAGAIGLGEALRWLKTQDHHALLAHEQSLLGHFVDSAEQFPGFVRIGCATERIGLQSFLLEGAHAHDIGTLLDQQGIAIRTGHHCAMPVMERFGIPGTARASFSIYNTHDEIDQFFVALKKVQQFL